MPVPHICKWTCRFTTRFRMTFECSATYIMYPPTRNVLWKPSYMCSSWSLQRQVEEHFVCDWPKYQWSWAEYIIRVDRTLRYLLWGQRGSYVNKLFFCFSSFQLPIKVEWMLSLVDLFSFFFFFIGRRKFNLRNRLKREHRVASNYFNHWNALWLIRNLWAD